MIRPVHLLDLHLLVMGRQYVDLILPALVEYFDDHMPCHRSNRLHPRLVRIVLFQMLWHLGGEHLRIFGICTQCSHSLDDLRLNVLIVPHGDDKLPSLNVTEESLSHRIFIGMMICLADIHRPTSLAHLLIHIDRFALLIQQLSADIATTLVAKGAISNAERKTFRVLALSFWIEVLLVQIIVTAGLTLFSCPNLAISCQVADGEQRLILFRGMSQGYLILLPDHKGFLPQSILPLLIL